ncbi:hypothetical protein [uncultured Tateyamaria sp.]|uniref:hypothetical protein n=1 Tax=uncultured Tateyamaria sp. TaxID=455651 RepID=UPI00261B4665|nr:hypothetical protein [uncultured Tateyamaria sp.]
MTTGYVTGQVTGSRWLQFLFMLVLLFGVPAGFIIINEFTEQKWKQLPLVIRTRSMLRWLPQLVSVASLLGYGIFGNIIFVVGAYLLVLPGVSIIALVFLEKYAQQHFRA